MSGNRRNYHESINKSMERLRMSENIHIANTSPVTPTDGRQEGSHERLLAYKVNPELIYSGEIWVLDEVQMVWRRRVSRFDGRYMVFINPNSMVKVAKSGDRGTDNRAPSKSSKWMSTTVSNRYFHIDDNNTVAPALDSPMLSVPKDAFKLLTGVPGEWIQTYKSSTNFHLVDLYKVVDLCVYKRFYSEIDGYMLRNTFALSIAGEHPIICRVKKDHEFKAWIFCINTGLRFLKPNIVASRKDNLCPDPKIISQSIDSSIEKELLEDIEEEQPGDLLEHNDQSTMMPAPHLHTGPLSADSGMADSDGDNAVAVVEVPRNLKKPNSKPVTIEIEYLNEGFPPDMNSRSPLPSPNMKHSHDEYQEYGVSSIPSAQRMNNQTHSQDPYMIDEDNRHRRRR